jgi:hypothetical protein
MRTSKKYGRHDIINGRSFLGLPCTFSRNTLYNVSYCFVRYIQVSPDGGIEDIFESPTLFNKKPPTMNHQQPGHFGYDEKAWKWYFFDVFASTFLVQFLAVTVSILRSILEVTCFVGIWMHANDLQLEMLN